MRTTIIIPNYNGLKYIEACLNSLKGERARIIVVDNGSSDGSYELVVKNFPEARVIRFKNNTGFCKAVNAGIKASDTEYVIFLNNDTIAEAGFVKELEKVMDRDKNIFSASAKLLSMKERDKIDDAGDLYCALGWAFALGKGEPETKYNRSYYIFSSCGGASIYRRSILEEIGLLDENHFAYLEDVDLGYRARLYGYKNVFAPKARVYHAGSAASGSRYNEFKVYLTARNSVYLIYKNMPPLQLALNLPLLLTGFGIKLLFFIRGGLGLTYIKGLAGGVRLCMSGEGAGHRVAYSRERLGLYTELQLLLWKNTLRRAAQRYS